MLTVSKDVLKQALTDVESIDFSFDDVEEDKIHVYKPPGRIALATLGTLSLVIGFLCISSIVTTLVLLFVVILPNRQNREIIDCSDAPVHVQSFEYDLSTIHVNKLNLSAISYIYMGVASGSKLMLNVSFYSYDPNFILSSLNRTADKSTLIMDVSLNPNIKIDECIDSGNIVDVVVNLTLPFDYIHNLEIYSKTGILSEDNTQLFSLKTLSIDSASNDFATMVFLPSVTASSDISINAAIIACNAMRTSTGSISLSSQNSVSFNEEISGKNVSIRCNDGEVDGGIIKATSALSIFAKQLFVDMDPPPGNFVITSQNDLSFVNKTQYNGVLAITEETTSAVRGYAVAISPNTVTSINCIAECNVNFKKQ